MARTIAIDVEYKNQSRRFSPFYGEEILTIAAFDGKKTYFWNLNHSGAPKTELSSLIDLLNDPSIEWVAHPLKHELLWLETYLPEIALDAPDIIKGKYFCTMIASDLLHLVDRDYGEKNNIETLAMKYCKAEPWKHKINVHNLAEEPYEKVRDYNTDDAVKTWYVAQYEKKRLAKNKKAAKRFAWEMKNLRTLLNMEKIGIKVDRVAAYNAGQEVYNKLVKAQSIVNKVAGWEVDTNPKITKFLYSPVTDGGLGMPCFNVSKTTGNDSADNDAINAILWEIRSNPNKYNGNSKDWTKVLYSIKEIRSQSKLWDTYLSQIPEFIQWDGRIHCKFNLGKGTAGDPKHEYGARTNRLSSSDPNMQNIPSLNLMRNIYIAEEGNVLIDPDYKQLELVVLAFYTQDPILLDAIFKGRDLHTTTLAEVERISYDDLNAILKSKKGSDYAYFHRKRITIKQVNFGVLFGIGIYHLQQLLREIEIEMAMQGQEVKVDIQD